MQVEKLVVVLEGSVSQLRTALAQGNVALGQTDVAAGKAQARLAGITKGSKDAVPSINAFRGSLTSLVASTLKLPGPLANVTGLLSSMAWGTGTTVAILGGLAAIAGAYKLLGKEASESGKLVEGAREALLKAANIRALGGPAGVDAAAARKAQAEIARLTRERERTVQGRELDPVAADAMIRSIDRQIIENAKVIREVGQQAAETLKKEADAIDTTGKAAERAVVPVRTLAMAIRDLALSEHHQRLARLAERMREVRNAVYGGGLDARRDVTAPGGGAPNLLPFGPTLTAQAPQGDGSAFAAGVSRFRDAVSNFRQGVADSFKGSSLFDLRQIGSNLAGMAIGVVAGKVFEGIRGLFNKQSETQERLANALERNTSALNATGDFLRRRVEGAGLGDRGGALLGAVEEVLNRFAVGELSGGNGNIGQIIRAQLQGVVGGDPAAFQGFLDAIARALGLDLSVLNEDTLRQLSEALSKAGFASEGLADAANKATEALRNVPEGFKATLDYLKFRATDAVGAASGVPAGAAAFAGAAGSVRGALDLSGSTINVYGVQNPKEMYQQIEREALAKASRGGTSTIEPAYLRRPR